MTSCRCCAVRPDDLPGRGRALSVRPAPFSPSSESVLTRELGLDRSGRMLDGGCGPGILTVRLAPLFEEAVGLDPDADMLAAGAGAAEDAGVTNIHWVQALAEELPAAAPGPFATGHVRPVPLDRRAAGRGDGLRPGGARRCVGPRRPHGGRAGATAAAERRATPIPHDEIETLVAKYLGPTRRSGQGVAPARSHRFEDVLVRTRFGMPRTIFVPGIPDLVRDSESVVAGYLSLSWSAPHLFGDRLEDFVHDTRLLLASRSPEGTFWDWPGDTEVVLTRAKRRNDEGGPGVGRRQPTRATVRPRVLRSAMAWRAPGQVLEGDLAADDGSHVARSRRGRGSGVHPLPVGVRREVVAASLP